MDRLPSPLLYQDLRVEGNLIPYLELTGWKRAEDTNGRWFVFRGGNDMDGEVLEIVLPRNPNARDLNIYLQNAVDLLSALADETPQTTIKRIVHYDRDVLYTRNLETGDYNSITLKMAAQQVNELRQMVNYAACSEHEPKPYFLYGQVSVAKQMVEHYRFGHTFSGSFGFTVESRIIRMPAQYQQMKLLPEDTGQAQPVSIMPIERRVMERVVRGLVTTQQATRKLDSHLLIQEYASGFNSNMCSAIVRLSQDKRMPLEYSVQWSPKLQPADDIKDVGAIRLAGTSYEYLEYAAKELRQLKPEYVTVKGRVTSLTSKENPLGTTSRRLVIVRARYRPDVKPIDIFIELEKDDYIAANNAHINWGVVEVSGVISRIGNAWRLSEPSGFKVVG